MWRYLETEQQKDGGGSYSNDAAENGNGGDGSNGGENNRASSVSLTRCWHCALCGFGAHSFRGLSQHLEASHSLLRWSVRGERPAEEEEDDDEEGSGSDDDDDDDGGEGGPEGKN